MAATAPLHRFVGRRAAVAEADETVVAPIVDSAAGSDERTESSCGRLLLVSIIWAGALVGTQVFGEPWRRSSVLGGDTEQLALAGVVAVLGLGLIVGFAQELAAVWTGDTRLRRVVLRLAIVLVAAAIVAGSVVVSVLGLGDRVAFAAVRSDYDHIAREARTERAPAMVTVGGILYDVEVDRGLVRLSASDVGLWGPPDLVRVEYGAAPKGLHYLGGGWYQVG